MVGVGVVDPSLDSYCKYWSCLGVYLRISAFSAASVTRSASRCSHPASESQFTRTSHIVRSGSNSGLPVTDDCSTGWAAAALKSTFIMPDKM